MSFFGDLIGGFTGKAQQNDIKNANSQATAALGQGRDQALGAYGQAQRLYDPYAQQGGRANALYGDALGVNGAGARTAATANFASTNPYSQAGDDYAMRGVQRQMNARGAGNSGNALLAMQRVGSERFDQRYNNWMGQLGQQGQQGLQATGAQAGLQQGMGDIQSGYSQQMAGNAINYGNAMAGTRNILSNNLMGLGGLALKAFAPTPTGMGGGSPGMISTPQASPGELPWLNNGGGSVNRLFAGFGRGQGGGL